MGLQALTWSLAPMGSLLAGFVADQLSAATAVVLGGTMVILFALMAGTSPHIRNLQTEPAQEATVARS